MKLFILAASLLLSVPGFAQYVSVYPTVINFGNSVQVQVNNTTEDNLYCTGSIMMMTHLNRTENEYYSEYVSAGATSIRMYYLWDYSDRILYTHQFINCTKAN